MRRQLHILALLLIAMTALAPGAAHAQLQDQKTNLAIGFNGGVNLNSVSFSPRIKQKNLMAPTFGFSARYISERYFKMICGLQIEVNYSQHGWTENIEDGSGDTYTRKMNYVEIPFLAHLSFGSENHGGRFIINLGPQIGFIINESEEKSQTWDTSNRTNDVVEQYGYFADKKFQYGITVGMGVEIRTGIGNFIAEGRYYYGLSDFYNNTKKDAFARSAQTAIVAKLTYFIDITK